MTTHTDRIRQMAQEARDHADSLDPSGQLAGREWVEWRDERFAQLVAEDCARMCAERAALMKMAAEQAHASQPGSVPAKILGAREVEARNCGQDIRDRYSLED